MKLLVLDIEIHDKLGSWSQATYLVHGYDDVLWTDSLDDAVDFIKQDLENFDKKVHNNE